MLVLHGLWVLRYSSLQVERYSRAIAQGGPVGERAAKILTKNLGGFTRDRMRSVAPSRFIDDVEDQLVELLWNDRAAATEWLRKADEIYDAYWSGSATQAELAQAADDRLRHRRTACRFRTG